LKECSLTKVHILLRVAQVFYWRPISSILSSFKMRLPRLNITHFNVLETLGYVQYNHNNRYWHNSIG